MSTLKGLVLDLIEQVEMSEFEDIGGLLKNNVAYVELKEYLDTVIPVSDEQSFKSGINDLAKVAIRDGIAHLKNCQTHVDGELVKFEIIVKPVDVV